MVAFGRRFDARLCAVCHCHLVHIDSPCRANLPSNFASGIAWRILLVNTGYTSCPLAMWHTQYEDRECLTSAKLGKLEIWQPAIPILSHTVLRMF